MLRPLLKYAHEDAEGHRAGRGRARRAAAGVRLGQPAPLPARLAARRRARPPRAGGGRRRPRRARPRRRPARPSSPRGRCASTRRAACATSRTWRRRRTWSACASPRSTRCVDGDQPRRAWWPPPRRWPRRCPTPRCARTASRSRRAACSTSTRSSGELVACGYERVDQVEERGQFAVRGDILDVYPATEERAVRCELFDVEVERLTWFSTFTQRSLEEAERVEIAPAAELGPEHRELAEIAAATEADERPDIADVLPVDRFLRAARPGARRRARGGRRRGGAGARPARPLGGRDGQLPRPGRPPPLRPPGPPRRDARPRARRCACRASPATSRTSSAPRAPTPPRARCARPSPSWRSWCARATARSSPGRAAARPSAPSSTSRACRPPSSTASPRPSEPAVLFAHAGLREGFLAPQLKLAVVPEHRLLRRRRARPPGRPAHRARSPRSPTCAPARRSCTRTTAWRCFTGFETKTVGGITRDYLELEFRDGDRVFVPSDQLHKISRYVGADAGDPQLSKLGGKQWEQQKLRARRAAEALAGELITLYAERKRRAGHAFPHDSEWQMEFEGAFAYRETPDQLEAIEAVRADMEEARPMDRLICGDVGYGKTEVALRAAFKAAEDGKQVMFLVPTTVLAQQHFGTFTERLRDYPFKIDMVSRFRSPKEARDAAAALRARRGRHPDRHAPAAVARRAPEGPRPADRGRGAALRREAEGAAAPAQAEGGRALAVGHADPAHAADVARRPARHLGDRDPARGPPPGEDLRGRVRRGAGGLGDQARAGARGARRSSCTTGWTRSTRPPSASARWCPRRACRWRTARWPRASSRTTCSSSCAATRTCWSAPRSSSRASTSPPPTR